MNICILIIDCLRADHLGCYGYPKYTSPNIDRIADSNVVFSNAYSQSNWTAPSFNSMVAGKYPPTLLINWLDQKINPSFKALPEYLAENGYLTGLFTPFKMLLNPNSFGSHFQEVREVTLRSGPLEALKEFIGKTGNSFLFFHTAEYVHEPYCADSETVRRFMDKGMQVPKASELVDVLTSRKTAKTSIIDINRKVNGHLKFPTRHEIDYLVACYDAGIYKMDRFVGQVHDILSQESENYLFMLIADHGQAFMEHGYIGHGIGLHNEVLHVPLIVDYNGNTGSRVISQPVQLMDIFPTITHLLGLEPDFKLDGESFVPALRGEELGNDRTAFADNSPNLCFIQHGYKFISSYLKYMETRKYLETVKSRHGLRFRDRMGLLTRFRRDTLFDLQNDPNETQNLSRSNKKMSHSLKKGMKQVVDTALREMRKSEDAPMDDDIKKQLKALGYL